MPHLKSRRFFDEPEFNVVLGPCPGCDDWQVDYSNEVAESYTVVLGRAEDGGLRYTQQPFLNVLEFVLREHMHECPHLKDLVEENERRMQDQRAAEARRVAFR